MGHFKAVKEFSRASRVGLLVGHPKHADPRGRFFKLDDAVAQPLVNEGLIEKISAATYAKGVEGQETDAGETLVDQVAGKRPKVSARMTDEALAAEAAIRGVDISKAKNRGEVIKLINGADTSSAPEKVDGTDNAWSQGGRETAETTLHSRRASPQNAVGANGTVDIEQPAPTVEEDEITEEEQAPTGSK